MARCRDPAQAHSVDIELTPEGSRPTPSRMACLGPDISSSSLPCVARPESGADLVHTEPCRLPDRWAREHPSPIGGDPVACRIMRRDRRFGEATAAAGQRPRRDHRCSIGAASLGCCSSGSASGGVASSGAASSGVASVGAASSGAASGGADSGGADSSRAATNPHRQPRRPKSHPTATAPAEVDPLRKRLPTEANAPPQGPASGSAPICVPRRSGISDDLQHGSHHLPGHGPEARRSCPDRTWAAGVAWLAPTRQLGAMVEARAIPRIPPDPATAGPLSSPESPRWGVESCRGTRPRPPPFGRLAPAVVWECVASAWAWGAR